MEITEIEQIYIYEGEHYQIDYNDKELKVGKKLFDTRSSRFFLIDNKETLKEYQSIDKDEYVMLNKITK